MRSKTLYTFSGNSADDVWHSAATCIREDGEIQLGRGGSTLEIYPSVLQITDPRQRLVYGRPINTAYGIAELIWNISGGKRTAFLQHWNSQINQYMGDSEGVTDSAYGFRLGMRPKLSNFAATFMGSDWQDSRTDQVLSSYQALLAARDSRQIVLQLWETERDIPNPSPQQEVPCIVLRQLLQRDGQLHWYEFMRSNDLMFGTPYDIMYATVLQEIMTGWLEIDMGIYTHYATSLHVYERHWQELQAVESSFPDMPENDADLRLPYPVWEAVWTDVVDASVALTQHTASEILIQIYDRTIHLPRAYRQWIAVLAAEALRRSKAEKDAHRMIQYAGDHWATSWLIWANWLDQRRRKAA